MLYKHYMVISHKIDLYNSIEICIAIHHYICFCENCIHLPPN